MPIIEGTTSLKSTQGEYSFAVDGGAVSTITLRAANAAGNSVPAGSVVYGGWIEVDTAVTGASATVAVSLEGAGDLQAAAAISGAPWSTTGRKSLVALSGATSIKTTVPRSITISIATAVTTAGVFRVVVLYR